MRMTNAQSLFSAAEDGDSARVARLLAEGAGANSRLGPGGETPLMRASARGHAEVARVLLDAGAEVSARRADGFTPLILAVFFGHEDVTRLLVERGADASARTSLGTTATRWAGERGFASMADLLRKAEAARPPAATRAREREDVTRGRARGARQQADEVEIFSINRVRRERSAAVEGFDAGAGLVNAQAFGGLNVAGREEGADDSAARASLFNEPRADASAEKDGQSDTHAAGVSVRRGGRLPAHPSASTFRLGHFMRSWQGSVGTLLLLLALGVAVFAFLRGDNATREAARPAPAPAPAAPQAAAQPPAPMLPTPQPSPAFPTPDAQGLMPVPDQTYAVPNAAGQPYYVPQGPVVPVQSDAPRELTVVSESGTAPAEDAAQARRRAASNANVAAPARGDSSTRNDNNSDADARAARTPEPEPQRPAPPPSSSNQPPAAAPQPTPARPKVIQWPPQ